LYGIESKAIPLTRDFSIRLLDYDIPNGGIVFANPNAPTGMALSAAQIEGLLKKNTRSVVVVDEAYVDFGAESVVPLVAKYPNLLVTHTFSKSRSLAGLRVGYAIGNADLMEGITRVKDSFNSFPLNQLALVGAEAAMRDVAHFAQSCDAVIANRQTLVAGLAELGFDVLPSATNFVMTQHARLTAKKIADQLRARQILVRHFEQDRISNYLRITVGTDIEITRLMTALREIIAD
jgi:histidinol-phosphate aminotransferase